VIRAVVFVLALAPPAAAQVSPGSGAVLRGLDKIDGRVADLDLRIGTTVSFGSLDVTVAECRYPSRNPSGDAYARLAIDQGGERIFSGWMVASSPALNALDHPRYDIWVIGCTT
jgi:hypothetical protein